MINIFVNQSAWLDYSSSGQIKKYLKKGGDVGPKPKNHPQVGHAVDAAHAPTHQHEVEQELGELGTGGDQQHGEGEAEHTDQHQHVDRN